MNDRRMARADLVTGAILFALAVAVVAGSWSMDRLEARRIHPLSAPGFTPGLLGLALAVTSALLIIQAVRRGGATGWGEPFGAGGRLSPAMLRLLGALALSLIYALGLIGRMPYWLATALFVSTFIAVFEWGDGGPRWLRLAWAVGLGLGVGLVVSYVFRELFLVRLP
jgi:putative tricarboxylic transport membrane protein